MHLGESAGCVQAVTSSQARPVAGTSCVGGYRVALSSMSPCVDCFLMVSLCLLERWQKAWVFL